MMLPEDLGTRWTEDLFEVTGTTGGLFWIDEDVKAETLEAKKAGKAFEPVTIINTKYKKAD